jgi:large subunit ribosomal protein L32e
MKGRSQTSEAPESPLELRDRARARRPKFVRQESWRYKKLRPSWRKPKGVDNKMRLQQSGVPALVKVGYRTPKVARSLHPSGKVEKLVHNPSELDGLDPKVHVVRVSSTVGDRKRALIEAKAARLNLRVLNRRRVKKGEQK